MAVLKSFFSLLFLTKNNFTETKASVSNERQSQAKMRGPTLLLPFGQLSLPWKSLFFGIPGRSILIKPSFPLLYSKNESMVIPVEKGAFDGCDQ